MDTYKLGINLGWYNRSSSNLEIFNQYKRWLDICYKNNIRLVRIFSVRWSIDALFNKSRLDLLLKIIKEADSFGIEVILVLNNFTDFMDQYYREFNDDKYTWNSYPLKKGGIRDFFTNLDNNFVARVKNVLDEVKEYENVKKIELFNEIDLVNIDNKILVEWINDLKKELSLYNERYKFYVSLANHDKLKLFRDSLSISIDVHTYNFPSEYAFKNIEYIGRTLKRDCYLGESAKFSDKSYLDACESKSYFCSGIWGAYLQGFENSPLYWWWSELLDSQEYLKIIDIFQKYKPRDYTSVSNKKFEVENLKILEKNNDNHRRRKKILFRLRTLILHPTYFKTEWGAIKKFTQKKIFSIDDKEDVLVRGFESVENLYFYCEPKNCQKISFKLCVEISDSIADIEIINLLEGKVYRVSLERSKELFILPCEFSSNHLIRVKKKHNG